MMSMADGGGSAAGQQVLNYLIIWNVLMLVGFFADNHLIPGGPGCYTLTFRCSHHDVKQPTVRRIWLSHQMS